ncbi:MAG: hypothetical protein H6R26_3630 [Proteobacteria bacterium]|nr:hypothetical protein [Pseudomonadota bacterium]
MLKVLCVCFWLLAVGITGGHADPITPAQVPDGLKPWIDWVLRGSETRVCPFLYNTGPHPG